MEGLCVTSANVDNDMPKFDPDLVAYAKTITAKRPRQVIEHILKHGHITTEELYRDYGYNHPPRAARDVREQGIPLDVTRVTGNDGRRIASYTFGDPKKVKRHRYGGRQVFSKEFKEQLLARQGAKCAITGERLEPRYLSIDHRVPYQVAGDAVAEESTIDAFMLISASAQRQKSWSCEHCKNWIEDQRIEVCQRCFWANPEDYDHIEMEPRRRLDLNWVGEEEAREYDALRAIAREGDIDLREEAKNALRDKIGKNNRSG